MSWRALAPTVISVWLWLGAGPEPGIAHPLNPALLELWESQDAVAVLRRLPLAQPTNAPLQPVLPDGCRKLSLPSISQMGQSLTAHWRLHCGSRSLVGARIGVEGLDERKTDALVRVHLADARAIEAVLRLRLTLRRLRAALPLAGGHVGPPYCCPRVFPLSPTLCSGGLSSLPRSSPRA